MPLQQMNQGNSGWLYSPPRCSNHILTGCARKSQSWFICSRNMPGGRGGGGGSQCTNKVIGVRVPAAH